MGKALLAPQGRRLVPNEAGWLALGFADQIFLLGEQMQDALSESGKIRLTVGISDALPKLIACRLLEATRHLPINALRGRIDEWLVQHGVRPDIVGEFEDNAMLNAFGRNGLGLFFAPAALESDILEQFGAALVGDVPELRE